MQQKHNIFRPKNNHKMAEMSIGEDYFETINITVEIENVTYEGKSKR
jgi:hypothetical protein